MLFKSLETLSTSRPRMRDRRGRSFLVLYWFIVVLDPSAIVSFASKHHGTPHLEDHTKQGLDVWSSLPLHLKTVKDHAASGRNECKQSNGLPGKCFPPESCYHWDSSPGKTWSACEWLHEPVISSKNHISSYLIVQPKIPLTLCCDEPALSFPKSSMRQLRQSFIEIPDRMVKVHPAIHECGTSNPLSSGHFHPVQSHNVMRSRRMVNGHSTSAYSHPWMAILYFRGQFRCGCSLLSDRLLVTAAHCLRPSLTRNNTGHGFEVMVGSTELGSGTIYSVSMVIPHPKSSRRSVFNDVAILITVMPIIFSEKVNSICLPPASLNMDALVGMTASMTGFGTYYYGGPLPDRLQETHVPIQTQSACSKFLLRLKVLPRGTKSVDSVICTGFPDARSDACQGDSGGPLTIKMSGRNYLIGVISFGYRCHEEGSFGVSTAVSHFSPWIRHVMAHEARV